MHRLTKFDGKSYSVNFAKSTVFNALVYSGVIQLNWKYDQVVRANRFGLDGKSLKIPVNNVFTMPDLLFAWS